MIPKKLTDFNESEHLRTKDAVLTVFSEALILFSLFAVKAVSR